MKKTSILILLLIQLTHAHSQRLVQYNCPLVAQENDSWCGFACLEMIDKLYKGTIKQCEFEQYNYDSILQIVDHNNQSYLCCSPQNPCRTTGIQKGSNIKTILNHFNYSATQSKSFLDWNYIINNKQPFIIAGLNYGGIANGLGLHIVVGNGYYNGETMKLVYINDPWNKWSSDNAPCNYYIPYEFLAASTACNFFSSKVNVTYNIKPNQQVGRTTLAKQPSNIVLTGNKECKVLAKDFLAKLIQEKDVSFKQDIGLAETDQVTDFDNDQICINYISHSKLQESVEKDLKLNPLLEDQSSVQINFRSKKSAVSIILMKNSNCEDYYVQSIMRGEVSPINKKNTWSLNDEYSDSTIVIFENYLFNSRQTFGNSTLTPLKNYPSLQLEAGKPYLENDVLSKLKSTLNQ
jgi:hypothetical protein